jgi:tRNA A-37 threonylcarbamoyl transferase component Bud32
VNVLKYSLDNYSQINLFSYNSTLDGTPIIYGDTLVNHKTIGKRLQVSQIGTTGSKSYVFDINMNTLSKVFKWDNNTIGYFTNNLDRTYTSYNIGLPDNLFNITIVSWTGTTQICYTSPDYIYAYDKLTHKLMKFKKENYTISLHSTSEQIFDNDYISIDGKIINNTRMKLVDSYTRYAEIDLDTMELVSGYKGVLDTTRPRFQHVYYYKDTYYLLDTDGTIKYYSLKISEPVIPLTFKDKMKIVIGVTISIMISGILFSLCISIVIVILIRVGTKAKHKKQILDIEMRLLESEVLQNMNASPEDRIKRQTVMIPIQDLKFDSRISEGANGVVYKGKWNKTDVAIKRIKATDDVEGFIQECIILNSLRHTNIVLLMGISEDEAENRYIITEFVENGNLASLLYDSKSQLSFKNKIRILKQVCIGMIYLHSLNPPVIHRDLKPQNILLDKSMDVKICDFGVSKYCDNTVITGVQYGTIEYTCPEILQIDYNDDTSIVCYDQMCDVYSFAIIMWELFFKTKPYHPFNNKKTYRINLVTMGNRVLQGMRPEIPFSFDNDQEMLQWYNLSHKNSNDFNADSIRAYFDICKDCWNGDPHRRPNFNTIYDRLTEL